MGKEMPRLLYENQVATLLGVSPQTLSVWRCVRRYGLSYIKCGRLIRYREADVLAFLEARTVRPEAAAR